MLKIEMATESGSLRDPVSEVLDVTVPEHSDLSLFRSPECAAEEPEPFDFIEYLSISHARELRRRSGVELVGPVQSKRSDARPLGKIRVREIRRRQLVIA